MCGVRGEPVRLEGFQDLRGPEEFAESVGRQDGDLRIREGEAQEGPSC